MKSLFAVLSISLALANSFQVDFPHDPKSSCPQYWVDATHVGMVRNLLYNLFVTSIHQTTNLDFPNFFYEFFSEKENKLFIGSKLKICFGPINSVLSFSTAQTEKNSWKKMGKTNWLFDGLMSQT